MPATPLTGSQRKQLRKLAHSLKPVAQIGKAGLSDTLVSNLDDAIDHHELVKVRFIEHRDRKRELLEELAERIGVQIAGIIGHVVILYRPAAEPEDRRIVLD